MIYLDKGKKKRLKNKLNLIKKHGYVCQNCPFSLILLSDFDNFTYNKQSMLA